LRSILTNLDSFDDPDSDQFSSHDDPTSVTSGASKSGGLSTGAKAGIGAGTGGVALIALLVLGFFLLRRRKSRQAPAELDHTTFREQEYETEQQKQMLPPQELSPAEPRYEMAVPSVEMHAEGAPLELPASTKRN
jgi:hypothetical protein